MQKISVVIVCKNEAHIIGQSLAGIAGLTDDIVVYDNGSTDGTQEIVRRSGARLIEGSWEGFGKTKNKANALARYDWILSLDADETTDEELKKILLQFDPPDEKNIYEFRYKNFLGKKWIRHGDWGYDKHIRLFNRRMVSWNEAEVHEALILSPGSKKLTMNGYIEHRTAASLDEYREKLLDYAKLNSVKYFNQNKKAAGIRIFISPVFSFIKSYLWRLGFLDGSEGFHIARIFAVYTSLKYKGLRELNRKYANGGNQSEKTS